MDSVIDIHKSIGVNTINSKLLQFDLIVCILMLNAIEYHLNQSSLQ